MCGRRAGPRCDTAAVVAGDRRRRHSRCLRRGRNWRTKLAAFEQRHRRPTCGADRETAEPETIDQYGIRVAEAGRSAKGNNGAILIIAMKEKTAHRSRLRLGRCACPMSKPNASSARSSHRTSNRAQFAQGIDAGIDKIQLAVAKENKAETNAPSTTKAVDAKGTMPPRRRHGRIVDGHGASAARRLAVLVVCAALAVCRRYRRRRHLLFTNSAPRPGSPGFIGFVVANILRRVWINPAFPTGWASRLR